MFCKKTHLHQTDVCFCIPYCRFKKKKKKKDTFYSGVTHQQDWQSVDTFVHYAQSSFSATWKVRQLKAKPIL